MVATEQAENAPSFIHLPQMTVDRETLRPATHNSDTLSPNLGSQQTPAANMSEGVRLTLEALYNTRRFNGSGLSNHKRGKRKK